MTEQSLYTVRSTGVITFVPNIDRLVSSHKQQHNMNVEGIGNDKVLTETYYTRMFASFQIYFKKLCLCTVIRSRSRSYFTTDSQYVLVSSTLVGLAT
jgi:hypothetical protein